MPNFVKYVGTSDAAVDFVTGVLTPAAAGNRLVAMGGIINSATIAAWPFTISCTPDLGAWTERFEDQQIVAGLNTAFQVWDNVSATGLHTVRVDKNPGAGATAINMFLWVWELSPSDFVSVHSAIQIAGQLAIPHALPAFGSGGANTQHLTGIISRNNRDYQNIDFVAGWNRRLATASNGYFRRFAFHDYFGNFVTATEVPIDAVIEHDSQAVVVLYRAAAPAGPTQTSPITPPDQVQGDIWGYDLAQHFTGNGALTFDQLTGAPTGMSIVGQNLSCDGTTPQGNYADMTVRCSDLDGNITSQPFGFDILAPAVGTVTTEPFRDGSGNLITGLSDGVITIEADTPASAELARSGGIDQLPNGRVTFQDPALTSGNWVFVHVRFPQNAGKHRHCGSYQVT